ncbi:MAG: hypothetical protein ACJAZX_000887 [Rickettsiales bacterium]|jgi:hypothetical protein
MKTIWKKNKNFKNNNLADAEFERFNELPAIIDNL